MNIISHHISITETSKNTASSLVTLLLHRYFVVGVGGIGHRCMVHDVGGCTCRHWVGQCDVNDMIS